MRYIALLRGINVGGHKKFPKVDQQKMLEELGYSEIDFYIHTGNWIFNSPKSTAELQKEIWQKINDIYQWDVPVIVLSSNEFIKIRQQCPFALEKREKSYITFFQKTFSEEEKSVLPSISFPHEEIIVGARCVYLYFEKGAGKAKCNNNYLERIVRSTATSRNFKTVSAIVEKL